MRHMWTNLLFQMYQIPYFFTKKNTEKSLKYKNVENILNCNLISITGRALHQLPTIDSRTIHHQHVNHL